LDAGPAVMYYITDRMNSADVGAIQNAIHRKVFVQQWKRLEEDVKDLTKRLTSKETEKNSQAWKLLAQTPSEKTTATAAMSKKPTAVRRINDFMGKWRQVRTRFPLPEMAELRITPELPEYPKIVEEMFYLMLDGKLRSQSEIIKFLTPYSPPPPAP